MKLANLAAVRVGHVKFVSYTGNYPTLCYGTLTLEIDGMEYVFGYDDLHERILRPFWSSGGSCGFRDDYSDEYVVSGDWEIDESELPEKIRCYAEEIRQVFNSNVPHGCCGGCL